MSVSVEIWIGAATLLVAIVAGYWALGKMLVGQFNVALDVRFEALEAARKEAGKAWEERFRRLEAKQDQTDKDVRQILVELPREYVRREDYVRGQSVIEAKIDALALRLENHQLRGRQ